MTRFNRIRTVLAAVASVFLAMPLVSDAQGYPDKDAREISAYVLSEAALAKYARATSNLGAVAKAAASQCDDDDETGNSLDANVAHINGIPGAQAAIQSAGMTTREYLVFTMSIFQSGMAAWALTQPGGKLPPSVSRANVDFYRSHEQALKKLASQQGSDDCDDRDEEPAEEEQPE